MGYQTLNPTLPMDHSPQEIDAHKEDIDQQISIIKNKQAERQILRSRAGMLSSCSSLIYKQDFKNYLNTTTLRPIIYTPAQLHENSNTLLLHI